MSTEAQWNQVAPWLRVRVVAASPAQTQKSSFQAKREAGTARNEQSSARRDALGAMQFDDVVAQYRAAGMSRGAAVRKAVATHPEAHRAYIAAHNGGHY